MRHRFSSLLRRLAALRSAQRRPALAALLAAGALLMAGGLLAGCDTGDDVEGAGRAFLEGFVVSTSGNPVEDATVSLSPGGATTMTDSTGFFSLQTEVDSTSQYTVTVDKPGYRTRTQQVTLSGSQTTTTERGALALTPSGGGGGPGGSPPEEEPGTPNNILLQSQTRTQLGVKEAGAPETARITFQVADSTGTPIDLSESTPVEFSFGQAPPGATIAPERAPTNNNGEVTVNVSSGTTAGAVQVVARAETEENGTIRSKPVNLTIHGGLPDQAHFTVGPENFNFQGLVTAGLTETINIIVGDQFGNPVVPGTAVYFTTDHGVIEGSAQTDAQGLASVTITSGRPYPEDGIVNITATTADNEQAEVVDRVPMIFSAAGTIKIASMPGATSGDSRRTFAPALDLSDDDDVMRFMQAIGAEVPFGSYEFIVEDRNGNPLPGGTTINFEVGGTEVGSAGAVGLTLGDTGFSDRNGDGDALDYEDVARGRGVTTFSGSAIRADDPTTAEVPDVETVTFSYDAPQTSRTFTFGESGDEGSTAAAPLVFERDGEPVARRLANGRIAWSE